MKTNTIVKVVSLIDIFVSKYIAKGDIVVDGTMGNGIDTLSLAKHVGQNGKVYSFDIQEEAIENTRALFNNENQNTDNIKFILDTHENLDSYIKEEIKVAVFNLGFLPRSTSKITTEHKSSLVAINKALDKLVKNGLVAITLYQGHEEGKIEKEYIYNEIVKLDYKKYHVVEMNMMNQIKEPPSIVLITKK